MSNYLLDQELSELKEMIKFLNSGNFSDLGFGPTPVVDCGGDIVGHIDMTESGEYGFYPGEKRDT